MMTQVITAAKQTEYFAYRKTYIIQSLIKKFEKQAVKKSHKKFTSHYLAYGQAVSWGVSFLIALYTITTVLGLVSLQSPDDPIGNPFFTLMEVFTILIAPLMLISMVVVHSYAPKEKQLFSFIALLFMAMMTCITSGVHFTILAIGRDTPNGVLEMPELLSFQWPSVVYALDILAWDWFFALAMLFAAKVFTGGRLEQSIRVHMITSGVLSLAGLIGVPFDNMQIRNVGIIGYTLVASIVFLLLGNLFGIRNKHIRKRIDQ